MDSVQWTVWQQSLSAGPATLVEATRALKKEEVALHRFSVVLSATRSALRRASTQGAHLRAQLEFKTTKLMRRVICFTIS